MSLQGANLLWGWCGFRLGEQQDRGGPAISGRGHGCCPVHDQDQEAEHPCQAPAQDSDAQGVPQDGQVCQEPGINSRVLYLNCPYAWLLSYNYKPWLVFSSSLSSELWHGMLDFLVDLCPWWCTVVALPTIRCSSCSCLLLRCRCSLFCYCSC